MNKIFKAPKSFDRFNRNSTGSSSNGTKTKKKVKITLPKTDHHEEEVPFSVIRNLVVNEIDKEFSNEIKQIFKEVEDGISKDSQIIESLEKYVNQNKDGKAQLKEARAGYDNFSLLHYAAKSMRAQLCAYLIDELRFGKDFLSKSKLTPLHVLIKYFVKSSNRKLSVGSSSKSNKEKKKDFIDTFEIFLARGSDVNLQDENGWAAIHHAASNNNTEALMLLINLENINLELLDYSNMTGLDISCKYGFDEIAIILIEKAKKETLLNTNKEGSPLHLACRSKKENMLIVKKILDRLKNEQDILNDASINYVNDILKKLDNNQTVLSISINNNHLNIIELLLKENFKCITSIEDKNGNSLIHLAAKNGSPDLLRLLIRHNAFSLKLNKNNENALHIAAANNKFNFIREFLAYEKVYMERTVEEKETSSTALLTTMISTDSTDSHSFSSYVPSIKRVNKNEQTPLFVAVVSGHLKCVEILSVDDNVELDVKDSKGNSIYHICAIYNHFESLRFLLTRKDIKFLEPLYIKNNNDDNVLHTACNYGNLEIIKLVINKIYDGFSSTETYLLSKNKDGYTCFHIACIKGYFNIIEFFLKDLKMIFFLENLDFNLNNPLHLASYNGHLSIVNLLIEHGINTNAKNKDGSTPLEISCRKGFFEISKMLILCYTAGSSTSDNYNEHPLHVACYEGAHEVVRLLLLKGAAIDVLNSQKKNCLDIAISQDRREVIRVLLQDKNWFKLIDSTSTEENQSNQFHSVVYTKNRKLSKASVGLFRKPTLSINKKENPQFLAMYEKKMWDMIKLLLDNCKSIDKYDFRVIDPPTKNIHKHPLMLLAKSGQEFLLKHDSVHKLLSLKWRFLPRFIFYANIFFFLLFLVLFSIYSIQLSNIDQSEYINYESKGDILPNNSTGIENDKVVTTSKKKFHSSLTIYLVILLLINLLKKVFHFILIDGLAFFVSFQNWFEIATYFLALTSLILEDIGVKLTYSSIAILLAYIVFIFLIQKLKVFGLYVLAFRRTLQNSAKFFPIFLLIYTGFNLSFRLRTHFGVSYYNTTGTASIIKTLTMVIGELDSSEMGLDENSFSNYLLYFLFISIMCVIVINLFVGIAVGEINTVLDEADIQQISMRIIFVLKVQEALRPFHNYEFYKNHLDLRFENYDYNTEYKFIKSKDKLFRFLKLKFSSIDPSVKLTDPQKRLEDGMIELARNTTNDLKLMRENLLNQIADVEIKLSNSQQRLEDSLVEMSRKTTNGFELTQEDSSNQIKTVQSKLFESQKQIYNNLYDLNKTTNQKFTSLKQSYSSKLKEAELNLVKKQEKIEKNIKELFTVTNEMSKVNEEQFKSIDKQFNKTDDRINEIKSQFNKIIEIIENIQGIQKVLFEKNETTEKYLANVQENLDTLKEQISKREEFIIEEAVYKTVDAINISKSGEKLDSKSLDDDSKHSDSYKKDSDEESVEKIEAIHTKTSEDEYLKQAESRTLMEETIEDKEDEEKEKMKKLEVKDDGEESIDKTGEHLEKTDELKEISKDHGSKETLEEPKTSEFVSEKPEEPSEEKIDSAKMPDEPAKDETSSEPKQEHFETETSEFKEISETEDKEEISELAKEESEVVEITSEKPSEEKLDETDRTKKTDDESSDDETSY